MHGDPRVQRHEGGTVPRASTLTRILRVVWEWPVQRQRRIMAQTVLVGVLLMVGYLPAHEGLHYLPARLLGMEAELRMAGHGFGTVFYVYVGPSPPLVAGLVALFLPEAMFGVAGLLLLHRSARTLDVRAWFAGYALGVLALASVLGHALALARI